MGDTLSSAVFIDRDGTIMEDTDYCSDPAMCGFFQVCLKRCDV